jgi:hypothetical protein
MPLPAAGTSLIDAVDQLGPHVGAWIVRPAPQTPLRAMLSAGNERIVVLSSAEEFARIAAYQRIKSRVEESVRTGSRGPNLGLAVLGAPAEAAHRAQSLLDETARASLGVSVPLVRCLQHADSKDQATEWIGFDERAPDLTIILQRIRGAATVPSPPPPPQPLPPPEVPAAAPRLAPAPKVEVELEPKSPVAAAEPDRDGAPRALAGFIEDLEPLAVRCPGHERPELAVDEAGRLHILARDGDLRELLIVKAWAGGDRADLSPPAARPHRRHRGPRLHGRARPRERPAHQRPGSPRPQPGHGRGPSRLVLGAPQPPAVRGL